MRVSTRPFIILPPCDAVAEEVAVLRSEPIRLVPHACEACGELTTRGLLCIDCEERVYPHVPGDPYDVLGGDQGTE